MQELKREKITLEGQLNASIKRATHHDDHLRTIDAWFDQVSTTSVFRLRQIQNMLLMIS